MATTPVATSSIQTINPANYTRDAWEHLFEAVLPPVTESLVVMDMAQLVLDDILVAPGAGKYLYVWGAGVTANSTGHPGGQIVLCEGTVITGAFATLPMGAQGQPQSTPVFHRLWHKCAANTKVGACNFATTLAAATARLRILFAVLDA